MLLALTVVAYLPVWNADWAYEDVNWIRKPMQFWRLDLELAGNYKIVFWISRINAWVGGFTPRSYHIGNVLLHLVNGVLVAVLAGYWRRPVAALVASMIFLLHPLQSESVAYISGRSELVLGFGLLVGLIAVTARSRNQLTDLAVCVGGVIAIGAKPYGIVAPLLLLIGARGDLRKCALPLAIVGLLILFTSHQMWEFAQRPFVTAAGVSRETYAWRQLVAVGRYLGMVFLPVGQTIDHNPKEVGVAILGIFGWLLLLNYHPPSRPILAVLALWIVVALAPRFVVRIPEYLNEHQFYVPMIGVSLALGRVVDARA